MKTTFSKGIVLGVAVSLLVLMATAAFAGTGVGAIFNLGAVNRVNATTGLAGAMNGPQLDVANTSAATNAKGIASHTAANRPPLAVSSSAEVKNLNANYVQGRPATAFMQGGGSVHGAQLLDMALGSTTGLGPVATFGSLTAYCGFGFFNAAGVLYSAAKSQFGQYVFSDGETGYFQGAATTVFSPDISTGAMETFQLTTPSETATVTILFGFDDVATTCHFSVQVVDSKG